MHDAAAIMLQSCAFGYLTCITIAVVFMFSKDSPGDYFFLKTILMGMNYIKWNYEF